MTADVALDPYSSDGHDGIVREDGKKDDPFVLILRTGCILILLLQTKKSLRA